jgi:hypothetical protein
MIFLKFCRNTLAIKEDLLPDLSGELVEPHHTQGVSVNEQEAFKQSMVRLVLCLVCLSLFATRKGVIPPSNADFHTLSSAELISYIPSELLQGGRAHPLIATPHLLANGDLWVPDHCSKACLLCSEKFGWFWSSYRRHHCRSCGLLVCGKCSKYSKSMALTQLSFVGVNHSVAKHKPVRVCVCCNYALE